MTEEYDSVFPEGAEHYAARWWADRLIPDGPVRDQVYRTLTGAFRHVLREEGASPYAPGRVVMLSSRLVAQVLDGIGLDASGPISGQVLQAVVVVTHNRVDAYSLTGGEALWSPELDLVQYEARVFPISEPVGGRALAEQDVEGRFRHPLPLLARGSERPVQVGSVMRVWADAGGSVPVLCVGGYYDPIALEDAYGAELQTAVPWGDFRSQQITPRPGGFTMSAWALRSVSVGAPDGTELPPWESAEFFNVPFGSDSPIRISG